MSCLDLSLSPCRYPQKHPRPIMLRLSYWLRQVSLSCLEIETYDRILLFFVCWCLHWTLCACFPTPPLRRALLFFCRSASSVHRHLSRLLYSRIIAIVTPRHDTTRQDTAMGAEGMVAAASAGVEGGYIPFISFGSGVTVLRSVVENLMTLA